MVAGLFAAACVPGGAGRIVARPPWVEDREVELREERLTLLAERDRVVVDVRYRFRAGALGEDLALVFPIPAAPARVERFGVALSGPGLPAALLAAKVGPGELGAVASFRVPWRGLARHRGRLRVRYEVRGRGRVRYWLESGAGWRGAIARLSIEVRDPEGLLAGARVPALAAPSARPSPGGWRWLFHDVEPAGAVELVRRAY